MSNPIFERHRPAETTTINGIPVMALADHLPPPNPCPECNYPTWDLRDPHARRSNDATQRVDVTMRGEYSSVCMRPGKGRAVIDLECRHPYHLVEHHCSQFRPHPVFPDGLIRRPR